MAQAKKTYKFQTFRREAEKARVNDKPRPKLDPFVIDDIEGGEISITAPVEIGRQLIISEIISPDGSFNPRATMPLLRALCGEAFPQVYQLIADDEDFHTVASLVKAILEHFKPALDEVTEAAELPGGSEDSSS